MRTWLSNTLIGLGALVVSWGGAVWYWRASTRVPSGTELAGGLLLLPLLLVAAFWGGKKIIAALGAAPAADAAPAAAANAPAAAGQAQATSVMLSGALRMAHGASAEELAEAILSKKASLELDPELSDDNGYPLLSGRVADVDELAQQELMADWLQLQPEPGAHGFTAEHWRALALAGEVVDELILGALRHPLLAAYHEATPAARAALALPVLQLLVLLPQEWHEQQRQIGADWLLQLVAAQGWPAERLALAAPAGPDGAAPFVRIGQLAEQRARAAQPHLAMVLACGSHIGERSVQEWAARGKLFTTANPGGSVPGEGAAGLLLADRAQAHLLDADAGVVLHGVASGRRGSSADGKGRTDTTVLAELSAQALRCAAPGSAPVSLVTADTDSRSSRVSELMGMAHSALPELDVASQVISVAASCGNAGAVPAIAALVLARQAAAAEPEPGLNVLCVSNQDPYQRDAVLVGPQAVAAA